MRLNGLTAGVLLAGTVAGSASAALSTGDIAFTGFLADGDDGFSIVALTDIAAGEEIFFRDDEWDGSAFGTGEGEFLWTTPAVSVGSVVTFTTDAGGTPTTFLAAIGSDAAGIQDSIAGTGLVVGTTAIELVGGSITDGPDGGQYTGSRDNQTAFADYLSQINDPSNWTIVQGGSGDQSGDVLPFDTTDFVIPEPGTFVLLGLGSLALASRRRLA